MGSIWLRELDAWCRADNIPFREYPGWETRSRSSGGFDQMWGIVAHHTGSAPGSSWQNDCAYMWMNATDRPIGNVHLDREGVITLGAAGATNTNGRGIAPWHTSHGVIPIEPTTMGNRMAFAIEAANNGEGEIWPRAQMDTYMRFMVMLCRRLDLDPMRDIDTHRGWAGTRKSDPFGPASGYPALGSQTWPTSELRKYVNNVLAPPPPPPPPPPPEENELTDDERKALVDEIAAKVWQGFRFVDIPTGNPITGEQSIGYIRRDTVRLRMALLDDVGTGVERLSTAVAAKVGTDATAKEIADAVLAAIGAELTD